MPGLLGATVSAVFPVEQIPPIDGYRFLSNVKGGRA